MASSTIATAPTAHNRRGIRNMSTGPLHEAARHESLTPTPWDEAAARASITSLVVDIEAAAIDEGLHWPVHPLDDEGERLATGFKSLYLGSAGVLWALWLLQREGAVTLARVDPAAAIAKLPAAYAAEPDTGTVVPSYFLGESGIQLLLWRLTGDIAVADRLYACVESNITNPTNEALWAAPGTMIAAWHLWRATAEPRWRSLYQANVDQLWRTWHDDAATKGWLWTQDMYGRITQYLGAGHGFAGNAYALLKAAPWLDEARREQMLERCSATLAVTAIHNTGAVNWPPMPDVPPGGRPKMLMQWCHGAPGVVTAFADYPTGRSPTLDALLLAAGEAIWRAGPLEKGAGVCHGTAGNGYAFLALHRRSGDRLWLDRARAFAMHAITQSRDSQEHHGRGRYTLWTGDAGVAVYLWHCLKGAGGLPALETLG
jgi:hypothetical protein